MIRARAKQTLNRLTNPAGTDGTITIDPLRPRDVTINDSSCSINVCSRHPFHLYGALRSRSNFIASITCDPSNCCLTATKTSNQVFLCGNGAAALVKALLSRLIRGTAVAKLT